MKSPDENVDRRRGIRVTADTLRGRFLWLLGLSVVLHLVATPVSGWLGLAGSWLSAAEEPPPPVEELDAIPIDLVHDEPDTPNESVDGLPEQDPVEVIDELIAAPMVPSEPSVDKSAAAARELQRRAELEEKRRADAAKERKRVEAQRKRADAGSRKANQADAGAVTESSEAPRVADAGRSRSKSSGTSEPRAIENPVALVGKTGQIVESNARLQLILYIDRIRSHAVGERVAKILPRLPQWRDFFGDGGLNPVRDFDRFFVAGPSFYYSEHLFVALSYNTKREKVRAAIDRLVQRDGRWLKNTPLPAAIAVADRAPRLFVLAKKKLVYIAPPKLEQQALALGDRGLPDARGEEALVAVIKEPSKSFWQAGLDIPKSAHDARLRITPLADGALRLEITAQEASEAAAESTATKVAHSINAKVELLSGVSNVLSRFGFGALTRGMDFPRVAFEARGKQIRGEVVLTKAQVGFILDRIERQLAFVEDEPQDSATAGKPALKPSRLPAPPPSASTASPK